MVLRPGDASCIPGAGRGIAAGLEVQWSTRAVPSQSQLRPGKQFERRRPTSLDRSPATTPRSRDLSVRLGIESDDQHPDLDILYSINDQIS
ncbi:hypothetical protein Franean1_3561 [Parafrankia sp. EAN1pec]|nr:hypothetical protein Franean1_3561 [Frankia sp. EAN1pec]